jgi:hypothetical protein
VKVSLLSHLLNDMLIPSGENFNQPKVNKSTSSGIIQRKPVADDGKSLRNVKSSSIRSRQSGEDLFLQGLQSSVMTRTPTSFESKPEDEMSLNQSSEFIPDLPSMSYPKKILKVRWFNLPNSVQNFRNPPRRRTSHDSRGQKSTDMVVILTLFFLPALRHNQHLASA